MCSRCGFPPKILIQMDLQNYYNDTTVRTSYAYMMLVVLYKLYNRRVPKRPNFPRENKFKMSKHFSLVFDPSTWLASMLP